jgi:tetratricopeptide (TPR) repeat protein
MRTVWAWCVAVAFAATATQADAAWYQASSKHFVIYANESPRELSGFASGLERFDQAVRFVRRMDDPPVGDGNRLIVFVMPSVGSVQKLLGGDRFIEGFYTGRASGSYAFVPRTTGEEGPGSLNADTIFFHEYAHHLMFQMIDRPLPEWVVEGFAEFMSTVRFEKNGDVGLGVPAYHRAWGLIEGDQLPLETMLSGNYSKLTMDQRESIYGRGWLLIHYTTFEKSRAGQLDHYVDLLSKGTPALDAARTAFGDLKELDHDLKSYLNRGTMNYLRLPSSKFHDETIDVRPLSEGAAKVMPLRMQSKRGVNDKTAEPLAVQVRAIEARYPGDELVELSLSEAEIDSGHFDAAEAAADRALKANPRDTKAFVFKGRATAERAAKLSGAERRAMFETARHLFIQANKIDTEDPEPLVEFYKVFVAEGVRPTSNAIAALHYASDLAPQDEGLRMNSAVQYLNEGKLAEAKHALTVIAYDPHGNELSKVARTIIEKIDAGDAKNALAAAAIDAKADATSR